MIVGGIVVVMVGIVVFVVVFVYGLIGFGWLLDVGFFVGLFVFVFGVEVLIGVVILLFFLCNCDELVEECIDCWLVEMIEFELLLEMFVFVFDVLVCEVMVFDDMVLFDDFCGFIVLFVDLVDCCD